jgi:hypothetical protein
MNLDVLWYRGQVFSSNHLVVKIPNFLLIADDFKT